MKKSMTSSPFDKSMEVQSTLIIHQGALGDFILALPSLKALRDTLPQAQSVIMGYPRILGLVERRFYADEALSIDQKGMASFFVQGGVLDEALSQFFSSFGLIVAFGKESEGSVIKNLRQVCQGRVLHINSFPSWAERVHLTEHLLKEISRYGFLISETIPKLFLNESDRVWASEFWRKKGLTLEERSRTIVLHPGSGSKKKVWPLERFLDLVHYLQKHFGSKILVVLGPAEGVEVQRAFEGTEEGRGIDTPILAKGLSLLQLASVMEGCRLFIGNDSGITHMAAALGLPTLAIFGPTDHRVWSPKGKKVAVVRTETACSPCSQERFLQCKHLECLIEIGVADVLRGLERIVA